MFGLILVFCLRGGGGGGGGGFEREFCEKGEEVGVGVGVLLLG